MADEKSRVQVSIRIRPLLKIDKNDKAIVSPLDGTSLAVADEKKPPKTYQFDHVLSGDQASVYETIGRPMLEEAYKGFNVCLFAYGQTGSGKTYSLLGDIFDDEKQGVAPRFVRELFDEAQRRVDEDKDLTIKVSLSMIEVYMEKVRDLLAPRQRGQEPEALEIHEDPNRRVYVKDASVHQVLGYERTMQLLKKGNANRQTAETKMNETSSRSHAIVQIVMTQEFATLDKKDLECTISLVDLAGSERQTKTESSGQHFEEAKKINHSLLMLGRALNSFSERKGNADTFISLRESKLTRLLSESFGGNSKTWMLATVAPTAYNAYETISTLDYASNAKAITNKVKVNNAVRSLELKELKVVVSLLEKRLEDVGRERDAKQIEVAKLEEECQALRVALHSAHSQEVIKTKLQNACTRIRQGNEMLRKRIEAASVGVMWPLDNIGAPLFFKGRCGVSLRSVFLGQKCSFSIPIKTESGKDTTCKLIVQLFPVGGNVMQGSDVMTVVGSDVRFVLHVVGAEGLPHNCSAHSLCLVSLLDGKCNQSFSTITCENTTSPNWDYVRQFELRNVTSDIINSYTSRDLFCFEIFGFAV